MYVGVAIQHGFETGAEDVAVELTLYVAWTDRRSLAGADVYVQRSPLLLPALHATWLGHFGDLCGPDVCRLVHAPFDQDPAGVLSAICPGVRLFWFEQNPRGGVDCYAQPLMPRRPGVFVHWRVRDIDNPLHWARGAHYEFVGVVSRPEWTIPEVPIRPSARPAPEWL